MPLSTSTTEVGLGLTLCPTSSPSTPPTSAPQSAKKLTTRAQQERRPKLRASCDACAASKVKCSKTHPICVRCSANGSECIYGVSRKHGKPGRTRKRNPDGTPFIKQSKQRPSPNGSEFSKFRVTAEPLLPDLPDFETTSWPSTSVSSWPSTPEFEYEMTPEPLFSEPDLDLNFMDDMLLDAPQSHEEAMQSIEPVLTFRDPFAKSKSMHQDMGLPSDFQALKDFIGGDSVTPGDYSLEESIVESYFSDWSSQGNYSPEKDTFFGNLRASIVAMPAQHCNCYNLAYSTLDSLQSRTPEGEQGSMPSNIEMKSLDSVLSVTKAAVQSIIQLLACSCSSDPHLAMLYSSIASKIINWYQIAAGLKQTTTCTPSLSSDDASSVYSTPSFSTSTFSSPSLSSSSTFSTFSSPLSTPSPTNTTFNIKPQPLKIGAFEFDEDVQEALRKQVVLRELKKSGAMIDALANWSASGDSESEQAEFLYDVLGAWLKSELYKTLRDVEGEEECAGQEELAALDEFAEEN